MSIVISAHLLVVGSSLFHVLSHPQTLAFDLKRPFIWRSVTHERQTVYHFLVKDAQLNGRILKT